MTQDNDNNKLVKTGKLPSTTSVGLSAKLQAAKSAGALTSSLLDCTNYPNRIVLCIDDSGSMSSNMPGTSCTDASETPSRMALCVQACKEFINTCNPRDTALGMYTISTQKDISLSSNYVHLLSETSLLEATGGTPTVQTLKKIQEKENVTRVVIVSDGESGALDYGEKLSQRSIEVLDKYKEKKCVIDTVFIGDPNSNGEREMKAIAEYTGGLFLVFKSGESFRTKFKYLTPAYRGMLTSGQVKI